jgi:hypothetical protein
MRFTPNSVGQKSAILRLVNNATAPEPLDIPVQGNGVELNNSIPLEQGWNFISLPLQPPSGSITTVLASIQDRYRAVYSYESNPGWKSYMPEIPQLSNLWEMVAEKGYWIFMLDSADLAIQGYVIANRSIPLVEGWNSVGFNSPTPIPIDECMESISDKLISVWEYDPFWVWLRYVPGVPDLSNLAFMKPGKGYWIKVRSACTWEY